MIKIKFLKFLHKNFILQLLFQSAQHFYEKGKDLDSDPDPDRIFRSFFYWKGDKI